MNPKSIAFTGHRKLPTGADLEILRKKIYLELEIAIAQGYTRFYNGCATGFDLLVLENLIEKKQVIDIKNPVNIEVICVIPYEEQAKDYLESEREIYYYCHEKCDKVVMLNTKFKPSCFKERNQYMIDHCDKVIAYYNGGFRSGTAQTVRMANKKDIQIINLY
ncbi:MAG: SLOG family protein [Clostridia bacterium]